MNDNADRLRPLIETGDGAGTGHVAKPADNTDLIAELNGWGARHDFDGRRFTGDLMRRAADALAARDAHCGHLNNDVNDLDEALRFEYYANQDEHLGALDHAAAKLVEHYRAATFEVKP
jgi:hypothetical protein